MNYGIYNKRLPGVPAHAVYVGRPTKWGNPFVIGKDGSRDQVIKKFRDYLVSQPELLAACKNELQGKSLVCWCAPEACHAEVLMWFANH